MHCFWEYSQEQVGSSGRKNRRSMEVMEVGSGKWEVGEVNFANAARFAHPRFACAC